MLQLCVALLKENLIYFPFAPLLRILHLSPLTVSASRIYLVARIHYAQQNIVPVHRDHLGVSVLCGRITEQISGELLGVSCEFRFG